MWEAPHISLYPLFYTIFFLCLCLATPIFLPFPILFLPFHPPTILRFICTSSSAIFIYFTYAMTFWNPKQLMSFHYDPFYPQNKHGKLSSGICEGQKSSSKIPQQNRNLKLSRMGFKTGCPRSKSKTLTITPHWLLWGGGC